MIQRIQSLWLFISALACFITIKLPFYIGTNAKGATSYDLNARENLLLLVLTILTSLLALITIFLYKQRKLQIRLCVLIIILDLVLLYLYYQQAKTFTQGNYALFSVLHSFIIGFSALAIRAMNKDEKLVKNSDRLR